jgi:hypothetical protein
VRDLATRLRDRSEESDSVVKEGGYGIASRPKQNLPIFYNTTLLRGELSFCKLHRTMCYIEAKFPLHHLRMTRRDVSSQPHSLQSSFLLRLFFKNSADSQLGAVRSLGEIFCIFTPFLSEHWTIFSEYFRQEDCCSNHIVILDLEHCGAIELIN